MRPSDLFLDPGPICTAITWISLAIILFSIIGYGVSDLEYRLAMGRV